MKRLKFDHLNIMVIVVMILVVVNIVITIVRLMQ